MIKADAEIVHCLLSHSSRNSRIQDDALLRLAAYSGKADLVSYFVTTGGNVHACHDQALRYACKGGFLETVKVLLEAGSDPNACNGEPMIRACRGGAYNVMHTLLYTLVADSCGHILGYQDIVQTLLNAGADPNSGLLAAIRGRHSEIVRLLRSSGATLTQEHDAAIRALSNPEKAQMGFL